jgi:hypothetical protein
MNVRTTLKTVALVTLTVAALGGSLAQADTTIEIERRPAPGWNDGPRFPPPPKPFPIRSGELEERIDQRQDDLMERIIQGIDSGRLNGRESASLLREQRDIGRLESRYLADGYLSRAEYRDLEDRLDAAERRIFREKHDRAWDR